MKSVYPSPPLSGEKRIREYHIFAGRPKHEQKAGMDPPLVQL